MSTLDPNRLDQIEEAMKPKCKKNQFEYTYEKGKQLMCKGLTLSKSKEKNIQNSAYIKKQQEKYNKQNVQNEQIFSKVQIKVYEDEKEIFKF